MRAVVHLLKLQGICNFNTIVYHLINVWMTLSH